MLVKMGAVIPEIVRAHHRRVAPRVAAAEPALLEHRDVRDAVILGKVIGGGQAVAAGPDYDDFVFGLRRRVAPGALPAAVAGERVADQAEEGVAHGVQGPWDQRAAAWRRSKPRARSPMRSSTS